MSNDLAVIVPAHRPNNSLVDLIGRIREKNFAAIIVVDEGSGPDAQDLFARLAAIPGVTVLHHAVAMGRGAALKTAFNQALMAHPALLGVVTTDAVADAESIQAVAECFGAQPECLVLGSRVPRNTVAGNLLDGIMGRRFDDPQTGLRAIPMSLLPELVRIPAAGDDFETAMIVKALQLPVEIVECPVGGDPSRTVAIRSCLPLLGSGLRNGAVFALAAVLDYLVYLLVLHFTRSIPTSLVVGRLCTVPVYRWLANMYRRYSPEQRDAAFYKCVILAATTGGLAWLGIQQARAVFDLSFSSSKIWTESVLLLLAFFVQRDFIFQQARRPADKERATSSEGSRAISTGFFAVFAGLLFLEVRGVVLGKLFDQSIWSDVGLNRFELYTKVVVAIGMVLVLAGPRFLMAVVSGAVLVLSVMAVGPLPVAVALLFLISACALGTRILRPSDPETLESQLCSTLLGTSAYIFIMTWTARQRVHYALYWTIALALPVLFDWRGVWRRIRRCASWAGSDALRSVGTRLALAVLLFVLGMHWMLVLKPENGADALSMHLAVPMDMAYHHKLTFEPSRFLWSVMPMGATWCFAIADILGREFAARFLNFGFLLVLLGLFYNALRRWVTPAAGFLMVAVFAASPLVQLITGCLFVENLLAAMVLGFMTAIWTLCRTGEKKYLYLAMVLGGSAIAIKVGGFAPVGLGLGAAFYAAGKHWKSQGESRWKTYGLAMALLAVTAAPTYIIAFKKTHNPLFPFFNPKFPSPVLAHDFNIVDERFRKMGTWSVLYDLTMHTADYYEGQNGSFGFQYLVAVPLGLLGFLVLRRKGPVSAALVGIGTAVIVLRSEPNARYLFAILPLVLMPFGALLGWSGKNQPWLYRTLMAFLLLCTGFNAYFNPASGFYHKDFYAEIPFSSAEYDNHVGDAAPVRRVIEYFNEKHRGSAVLFTHDSFIAGTKGDIYEHHWHQFSILDKIWRTPTVPDLVKVLQGWNIQYFVTHKPGYMEAVQPPVLQSLLESCTVPEYEFATNYLARLDPTCKAKSRTEAVLVVPSGRYDDFDPAIVYVGEWKHNDSFEQPYMHTVSFSNEPGATMTIAFEGRMITWIFDLAPNRGIAEVTIDGKAQDPADLYAASTKWDSGVDYCCFGPGRHVLKVTVTGKHHPDSSDSFVDVDLFQVHK